jgi:hypothetical protein
MERVIRNENNNDVSISTVLSIVAGILMVLGGISVIFMFGWYQSMFGGVFMMNDMNDMTHMRGSSMWPSILMPNGNILGPLIALSSLSIGPGVVSIIGGYNIYKEPKNKRNWALVVLTASVIALFGMGGLGIGAILGIIAGVTGMVLRR